MCVVQYVLFWIILKIVFEVTFWFCFIIYIAKGIYFFQVLKGYFTICQKSNMLWIFFILLDCAKLFRAWKYGISSKHFWGKDTIKPFLKLQNQICINQFNCCWFFLLSKVNHYVEKPESFVSAIINCGAYIFHPSVVESLGDVYRNNRYVLQDYSSSFLFFWFFFAQLKAWGISREI